MIFGQQQDDGSQPNPMSNRVPFTRPPEAGQNFRPPGIRTAFQTQFQPFAHVLPAIQASIPRIHGMQPAGPGNGVRVVDPSATSIRQTLPAVAQPPPAMMPPSAAASEAAAAAAVAPGQTNGFGASGRGGGNVPYRTMRVGWIPGIRSSGGDVRRGVYGAAGMIKRMMPGAFPNVAVPAGGYYPMRELPPAPAPVALVPAAAATHGWGRW